MYTKDQLCDFSYRQIQKLCKQFGLKANKKSDSLIDDLYEYFTKLKEDSEWLENELGQKEDNENNEEKENEDEMKNEVNEECEKKTVVEEEKKLNTTFDKEDVSVESATEEKISNKQVPMEVQDDTTFQANEKENIKEELMKEVEKRAKTKVSMIPKKTVTVNTSTPGRFKRRHDKNFKNMESIDDYMEKKKKRAEKLTHSTAKKRPFEFTSKKFDGNVTFTKRRETAFKSETNVTFVKEATRSSPRLSLKEKDVNTRKSVHFTSSVSKDAVKTPNRLNKSLADVRSPAARKTPSAKTPAKFDLQTSLKKGLSYKPYTGKLKDMYHPQHSPIVQRNKSMNKSMNKSVVLEKSRLSEKRSVKDVVKKPTSRVERRKQETKRRAEKRNDLTSKRRGISNA